MGTKEKIFDVSLELFSKKGFNGVSVRTIAKEVGIKESSIYNHYSSKQAILDDILNFLVVTVDNKPLENEIILNLLEKDPEKFYKEGANQFKRTLQNEKIMKIYRLIFIQMYQDEQIANFFHEVVLEEPLSFWSEVFSRLMKKGIIKQLDPTVLARRFYSYPIFLLLEIFIKYNSFPEEEIDKLFVEAEEHALFILDSVRV